MKKIFSLAMMAILAISSTIVCSCSNDDNDNNPKEEAQIEQSQWKSNIVGTWNYSAKNVKGTETISSSIGSSSKKVTYDVVHNEDHTLTVNSNGTASYSYAYDAVRTNRDDASDVETSNTKYTVTFDYQYVVEENGFGYSAYLKGTVKTSDYKYIEVGGKFNVYIGSMTKNSAKLFNSKESFVDAKTYTRVK